MQSLFVSEVAVQSTHHLIPFLDFKFYGKNTSYSFIYRFLTFFFNIKLIHTGFSPLA